MEDLFINKKKGIAWQRDMRYSVPYSKKYFDKYKKYEGKKIAKEINRGRIGLLKRYKCKTLLDFGIGSGEFLKILKQKTSGDINAYGYDINPYAAEWLRTQKLYYSINAQCFLEPFRSVKLNFFDVVTFWDSLEHISFPEELLRQIEGYIFLSIPIFKDIKELKKSKHYRPNEHFFYFTKDGLIEWMSFLGFEFREMLNFEIRAGREDVYSFVFKKF